MAIRNRTLFKFFEDLRRFETKSEGMNILVDDTRERFKEQDTKLVIFDTPYEAWENFKSIKLESFKLPFPKMAISYKQFQSKWNMLALAEQLDDQHISLCIGIETEEGLWGMLPGVGTMFMTESGPMIEAGRVETDKQINEGVKKILSDSVDMAGAMTFTLLAALSCKNVTLQHIDAAKPKTRKNQPPIMYNGYSIISVMPSSKSGTSNGSGTPTREHLRRGHAHRFKTKEGYVTHWINALVVNAGKGRGIIDSSYRIK